MSEQGQLGSDAPHRRSATAQWLVRAIVMIGCLSVATAAWGQDDDEPQFVGIRVGFDNRYLVGAWTQAELLVLGGRVPMTVLAQIRTEDGDGVMGAVVAERPSSIIPGQITPIRIYAKPGRGDPIFEATLLRVDDGRPYKVAEHEFDARAVVDEMHPAYALEAKQDLLINLGPSVGLDSAVATLDRKLGEDVVVAKLDGVEQLPTRWYGYDGVKAVALSTSQPEVWQALTSTSAQLAALDEWVRLGGRLLLSVGSAAPEALAPESPLARFVPGRFQGMAPLRQLRDLEIFSGATEPLSIPVAPPAADGAAPAEARLDVPQLTDVRGVIEVREGDELPLVIRAPYGFGEVLFVAVDLDRPPLARWNDRGKFVAKLLKFPVTGAEIADPNQVMMGRQFGDISDQLARALDEFVGVKIAPFALVAVLIAGYILLIGPFDYWLVKRVLKRMELTWITFPLMVVVVSGGAYLLASWMKGDKLLVNEARLIDVDLATNQVRGSQWINVFSPAVARYDVTIETTLPDGQPAVDAQRIVSWLGKPDVGFGGSQPGGASRLRGGYSYAPQLDAMQRVPIQFWSTKPFSARWNAIAPQAGDWIEVDLKPSGSEALEGQLVNHLPVALDNAMLLYKRRAYPLGKFAAGATLTIDPATGRGLRDELRNSNSYSSYGADMSSVLPRMMFYDAFGPSPEMQLEHRYQEYTDLSNQLEMGQAILYGGVSGPSISLRLDNEPAPPDDSRRWTYYRFLIPIEETDDAN